MWNVLVFGTDLQALWWCPNKNPIPNLPQSTHPMVLRRSVSRHLELPSSFQCAGENPLQATKITQAFVLERHNHCSGGPSHSFNAQKSQPLMHEVWAHIGSAWVHLIAYLLSWVQRPTENWTLKQNISCSPPSSPALKCPCKISLQWNFPALKFPHTGSGGCCCKEISFHPPPTLLSPQSVSHRGNNISAAAENQDLFNVAQTRTICLESGWDWLEAQASHAIYWYIAHYQAVVGVSTAVVHCITLLPYQGVLASTANFIFP